MAGPMCCTTSWTHRTRPRLLDTKPKLCRSTGSAWRRYRHKLLEWFRRENAASFNALSVSRRPRMPECPATCCFCCSEPHVFLERPRFHETVDNGARFAHAPTSVLTNLRKTQGSRWLAAGHAVSVGVGGQKWMGPASACTRGMCPGHTLGAYPRVRSRGAQRGRALRRWKKCCMSAFAENACHQRCLLWSYLATSWRIRTNTDESRVPTLCPKWCSPFSKIRYDGARCTRRFCDRTELALARLQGVNAPHLRSAISRCRLPHMISGRRAHNR